MPELPEVEVLARQADFFLRDSIVEDIVFYRENLRYPLEIDAIKLLLLHQPIKRVFRRAKYMLMESPVGHVYFHFGMSGNFLKSESKSPPLPHTHFSLAYRHKNNRKGFFHFVDPRRFGHIAPILGPLLADPLIKRQGIEPLENTKAVAQALRKQAKGKTSPIKSLLLDGSLVCGVGNIYASEALFLARLHPLTPAGEITARGFTRLANQIALVLQSAIASGGTSFRDFKGTDGRPGYFETKLMVYGKKAEACSICKTLIEVVKISGRSTFYCPKCQPW